MRLKSGSVAVSGTASNSSGGPSGTVVLPQSLSPCPQSHVHAHRHSVCIFAAWVTADNRTALPSAGS